MFGIKSDHGYAEILQGIKIKTLNYGVATLMTEFLLTKGAALPEHAHPYEQTGYLVQGRIKLSIGNLSRIVNAGDSWNIPANMNHQAEIIEDSVALEIFSPRRDDYLNYANGNDVIAHADDIG